MQIRTRRNTNHVLKIYLAYFPHGVPVFAGNERWKEMVPPQLVPTSVVPNCTSSSHSGIVPSGGSGGK